MTTHLKEEIKQNRPFVSIEQEAMLSIQRTDAILGYAIIEALKPFDITPTQYNVLRILRGAGPDGLCREDIRERLIAQVPDVTRLIDRLEQVGYVDRARDTKDRRLVNTRITESGLELLEKLDAPMNAAHEQQLGHLTKAELKTLIALLAKARTKEVADD
ncbi:MAG TPA: MarR family transcriptional regulator [Gemmatimonadaceae bacterium]|nr:MarR family transcriptional regulator [Gemmatimonadaceae bacterium]